MKCTLLLSINREATLKKYSGERMLEPGKKKKGKKKEKRGTEEKGKRGGREGSGE